MSWKQRGAHGEAARMERLAEVAECLWGVSASVDEKHRGRSGSGELEAFAADDDSVRPEHAPACRGARHRAEVPRAARERAESDRGADKRQHGHRIYSSPSGALPGRRRDPSIRPTSY